MRSISNYLRTLYSSLTEFKKNETEKLRAKCEKFSKQFEIQIENAKRIDEFRILRFRRHLRKLKVILGFRVFAIFSGPRPFPFMLWHANSKPRCRLADKLPERTHNSPPTVDNRDETDLFMWPDGLRHYNLWFSLVLASYFMLCGHPVVAIVIPCLLIWVVPLSVYGVARMSVHQKTWCNWDKHLNAWFQNIPEFVTYTDTRFHAFLRLSSLCLPIFPIERKSPILWSHSASPQKSFLKAGLTEFFSSNHDSDLWCDRGFIRWLTYWCLPVWASFLLLLSLLIGSKYNGGVFSDPFSPGILIAPGYMWVVFATFFMWRNACVFKNVASFDIHDFSFLPTPLKRDASIRTRLVEAIPKFKVKFTISLVQIGFGVVYLSLLNWMYDI